MTLALKSALSYPKFKNEKLTVLLLTSKGPIVGECTRALERMGHRVENANTLEGEENTIKTLLVALVKYKPDVVLSINHRNFDAEGAVGGVLEQFEIPSAVWYVDSPLLNIKDNVFPAKTMTTLFTWERAYIADVRKAYGIDDVHYLPLATDDEWFKPRGEVPAAEMVFTGDSMQYAERKWRAMLEHKEHGSAEKLRRKILDAFEQSGRDAAFALMSPEQVPHKRQSVAWDMTAYAVWGATAHYRKALLSAVESKRLILHGDEGWRTVLPSATYRGPVVYGPDLSRVFETAAVTLNATSLQMPTAVNQRVFDVPASGGFVLTDRVSDIFDEHFDPGDVAVYESPEELRDKSEYYLEHETERRQMTEMARRRVLERHTYIHRMRSMIEVLRRKHAPRGASVSGRPSTRTEGR